MTDIFISYARQDRALAEDLANDLKNRGYRVWWDAELVGSDDFYEVILQALHDAKAAIVIWSKASTRSRFVRDEARFADHLNKLIPVKVSNLPIYDIPFGFQSLHTNDVADRDRILVALGKLNVRPATPTRSIHDRVISNTDRVDELVAYLGASPHDPDKQKTLARLRELVAQDTAPLGLSEIVRSLRAGALKSFFSGLTFSSPEFSLLRQGAWSAAGTGLSFLVNYLVAFFGFANVQRFLSYNIVSSRPVWLLLVAAFGGLLTFGAWKQIQSYAKRKNLIGAIFVGISGAIIATYTCFLVPIAVVDYLAPMEEFAPGLVRHTDASQLGWQIAYVTGTVAVLLLLFFFFRSIKSAR